MSDHFATITKIDIQQLPPIPPPPPRWNQELANWNIFKSELESWVATYAIPDNIDLFEEQLIAAIHNAANNAMPKKSTGNFTYKDSWYYSQEVRELKTTLNRVRKLHKKKAYT